MGVRRASASWIGRGGEQQRCGGKGSRTRGNKANAEGTAALCVTVAVSSGGSGAGAGRGGKWRQRGKRAVRQCPIHSATTAAATPKGAVAAEGGMAGGAQQCRAAADPANARAPHATRGAGASSSGGGGSCRR